LPPGEQPKNGAVPDAGPGKEVKPEGDDATKAPGGKPLTEEEKHKKIEAAITKSKQRVDTWKAKIEQEQAKIDRLTAKVSYPLSLYQKI
jgi:hypothetical protein